MRKQQAARQHHAIATAMIPTPSANIDSRSSHVSPDAMWLPGYVGAPAVVAPGGAGVARGRASKSTAFAPGVNDVRSEGSGVRRSSGAPEIKSVPGAEKANSRKTLSSARKDARDVAFTVITRPSIIADRTEIGNCVEKEKCAPFVRSQTHGEKEAEVASTERSSEMREETYKAVHEAGTETVEWASGSTGREVPEGKWPPKTG